jgi:hypothetical protein
MGRPRRFWNNNTKIVLRNYRGTVFGWFRVGRCDGENGPLGSIVGRLAADLKKGRFVMQLVCKQSSLISHI